MNFKTIASLGVFCCFFGTAELGLAQDLHFSQFYETDILRNPALMGTFKGDYKIGAVYRSQWSSISKPFQTGVITAESRLPVKGESGDYFTVGLLAYYDKAGSIDMQTMAIYPAVSFTKYLGDGSRTFISAGFTGGYSQRSFDPSKMTTNSQYIGGQWNPDNPTMEGFSDNHISSWDLGAGIGINSKSEDEKLTYYAGVSSYHFTRSKQSFDRNNQFVKLEIKWNVAAGFSYRLSDQYGIQCHANYQRQGVYNEFIVGGLLGWKRITNSEADAPFSLYGGVFYRVSDAAIPTLKVELNTIAIAASYDFTTSKLRPANSGNGGFEITVMHSGLFNNDKFVRARTICPKPW
ncbi:MAG: PorP/SprF family type IX secretion system membrane protein [Bacteroidetes bacterium]|nr:PorP/SprF family type IX secretion system membrane protein [Bacteroidota bacterium]